MNEPIPAPNLQSWQLEHLQRYLASNGADGHLWQRPGVARAVPTLVLTTTGRKSGKRYLNPLIYGRAAAGYVVVASKGGSPLHPAWYLNLTADPVVGVQVLERKFTALARTAAGDERAALWKQMAELFPNYTDYQQKAGREIPVVVLDPA